MLKIATCNVNGIRAAFRKGMGEWLESENPDILALQEVRAPSDITRALIPDSYELYDLPCEIKGRAGVALAVRKEYASTVAHSGVAREGEEESSADTGRWLEVSIPEVHMRVVSAYLYSGDAKSEEKMAQKYAHLTRVSERLSQLQSLGGTGEHVLIMGDFNIVSSALDITNWKGNHNKTSGVLDEEIAYVHAWCEAGWVDVQRALQGQSQAEYTWWSQRGKAFDNNVGWRIDYHLASEQLAGCARNFHIGRAARYDERFSDHAPLVVNYDI